MIVRKMSAEDMKKELPPIVYKYRNWTNEEHKTIITKQIVFMARPTSFEDPKDCKLQKRYDLLTDNEIYLKYYKLSKENNPDLSKKQHVKHAKVWQAKGILRDMNYIKERQKEHFEEFDARVGVLSLTANPYSLAMWNKYSDEGRGFCVGFNFSIMSDFLGGGGKVDYYDNLPIIMPMESWQEEYKKQVYSKERKWEFEDEYRTNKIYAKKATNEDRAIKLTKECYKEIIFGAAISTEYRHEIITSCNDVGLSVVFYESMINAETGVVSKKEHIPNL